jgi:hypothetical protein
MLGVWTMLKDDIDRKVYLELVVNTPEFYGWSFDMYKRLLNTLQVYRYTWGCIFREDNSLHIHVLKPYRRSPIIRTGIKEVLNIMFSIYSEIHTSVKITNKRAITFLSKLKFKFIGKKGDSHKMILKKEDAYVWIS